MEREDLAFHYVCTRQEARELASSRSQFWASNCGCREGRGGCERSRMDVCLLFRKDFPPTGSGFKEITWAGVEAILREAEDRHLVTRPFRNQDDQSMVDGICFCCDDCCAYFLSPAEKCDKGKYVESTDLSACSECGLCEEVCYFEARKLDDQELRVERSRCYGCGLCVDVCPEGCIKMVSRV